MKYVYEQDYIQTGWSDEGGGSMTMASWYDRDITGDKVIPLYPLDITTLFIDLDVIYQLPPITVEITGAFFIDLDVIYGPMSVRALLMPAQMLKNEVRRVR